jgi:transcription termination/antitermination protein NusG
MMNGSQPKWAWYVLYGYPGHEETLRDRLRQGLEDAGLLAQLGDVLVPASRAGSTGQLRTVSPELFPGAVFVLVNLSEPAWQVIRQTPGLTGFFGSGSKPLAYRPALPPDQREYSPAPSAPEPPAQQGATVRILTGPFRDFRGMVMEIDRRRARLRVMVEFHQRPTPVDLSYDEVIND